MQILEAMTRSYEIAKEAGLDPEALGLTDFAKYAPEVVHVVSEWSKDKRAKTPWLVDWLQTWRRMSDEFAQICERDPMIRYRPKHKVAEEFHRSKAWARYYSGGNRTSKTTSGYAEHYLLHTGSNIYRAFPQPPHISFIVAGDGQPFKSYAPNVYETKLIKGEPGDYLTPMFPEGGKWFNHYDAKTHVLKICCPACAKDGRAGTWCPKSHVKSSILLFSSEQGPDVIEAFSGTLGHGDEHVSKEFFVAMQQRIGGRGGAGGGSLIFTNTPRQGLHAWEETILRAMSEMPPERNRTNPDNPDSQPYASYHTISKRAAGIVSADQIAAEERNMDAFERMARIEGLAAPIAKNPVFDRAALAEQETRVRRLQLQPKRGALSVVGGNVVLAGIPEDIEFHLSADPNAPGPLRVWEEPTVDGVYVMGVDSANGLTGKDAACCTVAKVSIKDQALHLQIVAQWHGWKDPIEYAYEVKKLGVWYNYAQAVIELTGIGRATLLKLKNELLYWNIFTDPDKPENIATGETHRLGVDTNASSKPMMIAMLQDLVIGRRIKIDCLDTLREMSAYEQERTESGLTTRYKGAGDHDDRVMSLVILAFAVTAYPMVTYMSGTRRQVEISKAALASQVRTEDELYYKLRFNEASLPKSESPFDD